MGGFIGINSLGGRGFFGRGRTSLFVAVGATATFNGVMTSADGLTWTIRTVPTNIGLNGVAYAPQLSLFVAVAGAAGGTMLTSPNAIVWTENASMIASGEWRAIAWSPTLNLFAAVGGSAIISTSPDGLVWTPRTGPVGVEYQSILWVPWLNLFVAGNNAGTRRIVTSPDGITWTYATAAAREVWGLAMSSNLLVASANEAAGGMSSVDGLTWTNRNAGGSGFFGCAFGAGLFVQVASTTNIRVSPDGINWAAATLVPDQGTGQNPFRGCAYSSLLGLFVTTCQAPGTSGFMVATSPDGNTWTLRPTPLVADANNWNNVIAAEVA